MVERLFTIEEAADALGTSTRFPRRLVAQRRIRFVKVGKFVRIPESFINEFVDEGTVDMVVRPKSRWTS